MRNSRRSVYYVRAETAKTTGFYWCTGVLPDCVQNRQVGSESVNCGSKWVFTFGKCGLSIDSEQSWKSFVLGIQGHLRPHLRPFQVPRLAELQEPTIGQRKSPHRRIAMVSGSFWNAAHIFAAVGCNTTVGDKQFLVYSICTQIPSTL